jgi:hypothetical protein
MGKIETAGTDIVEVPNKMLSFISKTGMLSFVAATGVGFIAYSSTHVYVYFCAPSGFYGFIQSMLVMDSAFCQCLMGVITHSQNLYGAMIVGILFSGIGLLGKVISYMTGEPEQPIPMTIQQRTLNRRR